MAKSEHSKFKDKVKQFLQGEKQKKSIFSTVTCDDILLNIRGEVQREAWKDLWTAVPALGWFYFCNKISLTIENKVNGSINTCDCKQPLVLNLDVKGTPNSVELLEKSSPELTVDVKEGNIVVENVQIDSGESLKLIFLAWFAVHVSEL